METVCRPYDPRKLGPSGCEPARLGTFLGPSQATTSTFPAIYATTGRLKTAEVMSLNSSSSSWMDETVAKKSTN